MLSMMLEQGHVYSSLVMQFLSRIMVQDVDGYLGRFKQVPGPVFFQVKLDDGRTRRCHQDQIRIRIIAPDMSPESD